MDKTTKTTETTGTETTTSDKKTSNIVKLEDGTFADFKTAGTVIASYDVESRTLTFKVATGEVISYTLTEEEQANLSENQIEHILYARQEKVKSTLPPVPLNISEDDAKAGKLNKAAKIRKELADLAEGKFVTRSAASGGNIELDEWLKAWAIVNAYGAVFLAGKVEETNTNRYTVTLIKWDHSSSLILGETKPEWANINDPAVIADVLSVWKGLSREAKAEQKRSNTFVNTQVTQLDLGIVTI